MINIKYIWRRPKCTPRVIHIIILCKVVANLYTRKQKKKRKLTLNAHHHSADYIYTIVYLPTRYDYPNVYIYIYAIHILWYNPDWWILFSMMLSAAAAAALSTQHAMSAQSRWWQNTHALRSNKTRRINSDGEYYFTTIYICIYIYKYTTFSNNIFHLVVKRGTERYDIIVYIGCSGSR